MLDEAERTMVNLLRGEAGTVEGERFSFVGEDANLNDDERRALQEAKERLAKGENSEKIRQDTNWSKGKDGKWRMEVDDSKAVYYPKGNAQTFLPKWERTVSDYLDHPDLQRLMPEIFKLPMKVDQTLDPETNGEYGGRQAGIRVREGAGKSTVLHEVQHGIQDYSDFARGSSVRNGAKWALLISYQLAQKSPEYQALQTSAERLSYVREFAKKMTPYRTMEDAARRYYENAAGEVEARDVADRANLSMEERKNRTPNTGGNTVLGENPDPSFIDMLQEMGYSERKIKLIMKKGV